MAETVKAKATTDLLVTVYKNVKMASDSILNVMPKVKNEQLKSQMTVELSAFEAFASRAAKLLADEGKTPEEDGVLAKLGAKWGTIMNTMMDQSTSHLAEMMIEGATMGVTDLTREIREVENRDVSESALRLARDVCAFEEKIIEEMKNYL